MHYLSAKYIEYTIYMQNGCTDIFRQKADFWDGDTGRANYCLIQVKRTKEVNNNMQNWVKFEKHLSICPFRGWPVSL